MVAVGHPLGFTGTVVATSRNHSGIERQATRARSGTAASAITTGLAADVVDNATTHAPMPSTAPVQVGSICELFGRTQRL